jgi:putative MATE family efflux protein
MAGKKFTLQSLQQLKKINSQAIWTDIKEALAGTERDFTDTPLGKSIFILAVPMVLEMLMESVFAVVDIYFVSKLGANAVATVGLTESALTIVYAIGMGLSIATTALVSRRIGEKKPREAGLVAFQAIAAGIIVSLIIAIPGFLFAQEFLSLMGGTEAIVAEGYVYPTIMFSGNVVIMLLFIINAVLRSSGDAAISMRIMWTANLINLALDPLLIFGLGPFPELGLKGAAIATTSGRGIAVIYQFYILFRGKRRIKLYLSSLKIRLKILWNLLKVSSGGILQNLVATSSWVLLVRIIAVSGPTALAGYTIAIRIIIFALLPAWGLSNAASTLVGQNLGAGHPQRAERSVWITAYVNMVLMGILGLILVFSPEFFIGFFIDDPHVIADGIICLKIISFGFVMYALGMVLVQGFNGSGDTMTPTIINLFSFWLLEIPLAYLLAITFGFGLNGACWAIIVAESTLTLISIFIFKRGKWKLQKV